jgi:hypothetical protein
VRSQREHGTSPSDTAENEGIINIKTNKMNFKKSQSMKKIKVAKNIRMKRIKLKRATKRKGSKDDNIGGPKMIVAPANNRR